MKPIVLVMSLLLATAFTAVLPTAEAANICTVGSTSACPGAVCVGKDAAGQWESCFIVWIVCVTEPCDGFQVCAPCPSWWPL